MATFFANPASGQESEPLRIPVPQSRPDKPSIQQTEQPREAPPKPVYRAACPALLSGKIKALPLARLSDGECGERSPLSLQGLGQALQAKLKPAPKLNCRMATALSHWFEVLDKAARNSLASPVTQITGGPGYHCRRRNNLPDGKISEHGFANALDITGFKLADGRTITFTNDWVVEDGAAPSPAAAFLRTIHAAACDRFTTVLGPEANKFHSDHLHVDLGCHGKTCTYKLCQ